MKQLILKGLVTLLFCISLSVFLDGQKQGNIWFYGEGNGLDFNTDPPSPISGGQIRGYPRVGENPSAEGSSVICDENGSLLFYSNGQTIWNRNHVAMPNGSGLLGMYSSTHPALIIPQPGSDSLFYVFTTSGLERDLEGGFRYSKVDMCLDSGLGDVIQGAKNIKLLDRVSEKIAAVKHANGVDYWVVTHEFGSNRFFSYHVNGTGVLDPVISEIGFTHQGMNANPAIGQMKISSNGKKLALIVGNMNPNYTELSDFNNETGVVSNSMHLDIESSLNYGIEFSPNSELLYVAGINGITQYDLTSNNGATIVATEQKLSPDPNCFPRSIQLGPDNKIYAKSCGDKLDVIHNPDIYGTGADFASNSFATNTSFSFPSFVAGYSYNNGVAVCNLPENTVKLCIDGIDNDGDGLTDCNDEECLYRSELSMTICSGETYLGYSTEGLHLDTLQAVTGCDSIVRLQLYVTASVESLEIVEICAGEEWEGYQTSGEYVDTFLQLSNGCDSIRTLELEVTDYSYDVLEKEICMGSDFRGYTSSGIYLDTIQQELSCDSILEIRLSVLEHGEINETVTINNGESYEGYSNPGTYIDTVSSEGNCFVIRNLKVNVSGLYIPNIFSPNDDGVNDYFEIFNLPDNSSVITFRIFDRLGNQMFTSSTNLSWDGRVQGKLVIPGLYSYYLEAELNGKLEVIVGSVTLIR